MVSTSSNLTKHSFYPKTIQMQIVVPEREHVPVWLTLVWKFCCEITKGAWKFRNSIQPNGSETFRKFFHLFGWNGKSEVSVQVPFKFLKLFSCVQSSLRTTARRGLCWQRISGNRYLQNSFRNESQKTPTFLKNKIKKLICVILLMVMVTCGKSLIPSLCANIALVSRLVICSARAARYLSLLDTR